MASNIILIGYVAIFFIRLEKMNHKKNYIKLVKRGESANYFSTWKIQRKCHAKFRER